MGYGGTGNDGGISGSDDGNGSTGNGPGGDTDGNGTITRLDNENLPPVNNRPPTDIFLSGNSLNESLKRVKRKGTRIGELSATDPDSGLPFTYQLIDSANGAFILVDDALVANREFDYEKDNAYSIAIEVRDGSGNTYQKRFTVRINNLKDSDRSLSSLGNSMGSAFYLGDLATTLTEKDTIGFVERGKRDKDDYISFNLVQNGSLTVNLSRLKADADFQVLDAAGNVIGQSQTNGKKADDWTSNFLVAGTYTIRIYPGKKGVQTRYTLSLSTTPTPTQTDTGPSPSPSPGPSPSPVSLDPNGTFENGALNFDQGIIPVFDAAALFGFSTYPQIQPGYIGFYETYGRDVDDYIKFTVTDRSSIAVSLSGLTADADLTLYDSNFNKLSESTNSGPQADTLLGYDFAPGDYYARITPFENAQTSYNLSLIADTPYYGFGSILYVDPVTGTDQYLGTLNTQYSTDPENSSFLSTTGTVSPTSDEFYGFRVGSFNNDDIYVTLFTFDDNATLQIYNSAFEELYYTTSSTYSSYYGAYYETIYLSSLNSYDDLRVGDIYYARVVATGSSSSEFVLSASDISLV